MTKQDSIFPNVHLPGGISSKATEYKELALKGDSWESPIFKLGSASVTPDIPSAQEIRRKQHSVTQGGIRGPQNIGNTGSMSNQTRDPAAQDIGTASGYSTGQTGYGAPSTGYSGAGTGAGFAGNTTSGFSNQVDQAFSKQGTNGSALNGSALNGKTNSAATNGGYHTTLGAKNPVMTGSI